MISALPLRAAGIFALLLGLSGCGYNYSLEERIAALQASGCSVEPRESMKPQAQRRARAQSDNQTVRTDSMESAGSRMEQWKPVPADHKPTPVHGSPEWAREQAEAKEKLLSRPIDDICRGC